MIDLECYRPVIFPHGKKLFVKCKIRNCDVIATPEEVVRQKILRFLLEDRNWSRNRLRLEKRLQFVDGFSGRADIVYHDEKGQSSLVVECKEPFIKLGEDVKRQAIRYAQVLRGKEVWLTNGHEHRFFVKSRSGWVETNALAVLDVSLPLVRHPEPPKNSKSLPKFDFGDLPTPKLREFAVCTLHLIYAEESFYRLPWSYRGVHILEDRGISDLTIRTPGGAWNTSYRLFLVATEGRVVTAGIGLNPWGPENLILCAAFLKQKRKHHSLQLQVDKHVHVGPSTFTVSHDGRMGGRSLKRELVINALYESCRDDLLDDDETILLGSLPIDPNKMSWRTSRRFLSNFFHYAIIRSDLREANTHRQDG